jgi:hypothetical protein
MKITLKKLKESIKTILKEQETYPVPAYKEGDKVAFNDGRTGTVESSRWHSSWETYVYKVQLDPDSVGENRVGYAAASEEGLTLMNNDSYN